ncbi:hypothetical protein [uncultured Paraglaciecola sp.]|uniref:hypothetical protein n=1 Tax=uncultured Paraglaciecola sp. TaxID=1765024 RepID=UPI00261D1386|nr:hypothetical protein [uncultured Paraglaciecola sp.]
MSNLSPTTVQKSALVAATKQHAELDILIRGTYGRDDYGTFKACSVGCLAHDIDPHADEHELHKIVSVFYGYPEWLVHLQDSLFENTEKDIHVKLAKAIKPRDNWKSVMHVIHWRILQEVTLPVAGSSKDVVQQVINLHKTESEESAAWSAARSAADSAADSAAESAAWSAAKSAARSAAWSAADSAADSAAWSAAWSAAKSAAWSAAWSAAKSAAWSAAWQTIMNIVLEEVAA